MRWFSSLMVAAFLVVAVGACDTTVEGELWIDPCFGTCLADEMCWEDGLCYPQTDCPYDICAFSDTGYGCVDTMTDQFNCGGCGFYCDGLCAFGECQAAGYTCADYGLDDCGYGCVDMFSDVFNCGACGAECFPGDFCAGGVCGSTCTLDTCGDICTDLMSDPYNCGFCGTECVNGCLEGACL